MPLDARTVRRLLTPFEWNCFQLVSQLGNDPAKIADALRGGYEQIDVNEDGKVREDGMPIVRVVGRDFTVTTARVAEALSEARRKIARSVEGTTRATNGSAPRSVWEEPEEAEELRRDDPLQRLRDGMPPRRSSDPDADRQIKAAGGVVKVGDRRKDRVGPVQQRVLDYLREHGPSLQAEVTKAVGLGPNPSQVLASLEGKGLVVRGGLSRKRAVALPGQNPDDALPSTPAEAEPPDHGAGAGGDAEGGSTTPAPAQEPPPAEPPGLTLEQGKYFDALVGRVRHVESCEEHVFERVEKLIGL